MRAPEAADALLAGARGESGRGEARPGFGGGGEGRDPARAGPDQPMGRKGRWVCRASLSPRDNGGGEMERRSVGRWGGAEEKGEHPARELIGEHEEAWPVSAHSKPGNLSFRKKGQG